MVPTQNVPEIPGTPASGCLIGQIHGSVFIQFKVPWSFYKFEMLPHWNFSVCVDNNNKFIGCCHIGFCN